MCSPTSLRYPAAPRRRRPELCCARVESPPWPGPPSSTRAGAKACFAFASQSGTRSCNEPATCSKTAPEGQDSWISSIFGNLSRPFRSNKSGTINLETDENRQIPASGLFSCLYGGRGRPAAGPERKPDLGGQSLLRQRYSSAAGRLRDAVDPG